MKLHEKGQYGIDFARRVFGLGFQFLYPPTGNPWVLVFMNPPVGSWRVPMGNLKYPNMGIKRE